MSFKELPIMPDESKGVTLFYPYISKKSANNIKKNTVSTFKSEMNNLI